MNTPIFVTACIVASAVTAAATTQLVPAPVAAAPLASPTSIAADSSAGIEQLERTVAALTRRVEDLALAPVSSRRAAVVATDPDEVQRLVEEALGRLDIAATLQLAAAGAGTPEDPRVVELRALVADPKAAVAALLAAGHGTDAATEIWAAAAKAGTTEALLDAFRRAAELAPNSADASYDLARAALAAAQENPNHANGSYWGESDTALGRVLEIDPGRADARYEKANSLCYWPDVLGRKPEAIGHFEQLIDQGASLSEARHLHSISMLGTLYLQVGRIDDAAAVWSSGLDQYPGDATLAQKIGELDTYGQ